MSQNSDNQASLASSIEASIKQHLDAGEKIIWPHGLQLTLSAYTVEDEHVAKPIVFQWVGNIFHIGVFGKHGYEVGSLNLSPDQLITLGLNRLSKLSHFIEVTCFGILLSTSDIDNLPNFATPYQQMGIQRYRPVSLTIDYSKGSIIEACERDEAEITVGINRTIKTLMGKPVVTYTTKLKSDNFVSRILTDHRVNPEVVYNGIPLHKFNEVLRNI